MVHMVHIVRIEQHIGWTPTKVKRNFYFFPFSTFVQYGLFAIKQFQSVSYTIWMKFTIHSADWITFICVYVLRRPQKLRTTLWVHRKKSSLFRWSLYWSWPWMFFFLFFVQEVKIVNIHDTQTHSHIHSHTHQGKKKRKLVSPSHSKSRKTSTNHTI